MTTVRYRYNPNFRPPPARQHADRATLWILVAVVVTAVIALTFGEAEGAPMADTLLRLL